MSGNGLPAITLTGDIDEDALLNVGTLASAALSFAARAPHFPAFRAACIEAAPSVAMREWLVTMRPEFLVEFAQMIGEGVVAQAGDPS